MTLSLFGEFIRYNHNEQLYSLSLSGWSPSSYGTLVVITENNNHHATSMLIYRAPHNNRIYFYTYPFRDPSKLLHSIGLDIFDLDLFWHNLPEPYRNFPKKLLSRARKYLIDYILSQSKEGSQ